MIVTWMLSAMLFTLLLGCAAHCAELALRAAGRQARWGWLGALGASIAWPLAAPWIRDALPSNGAVHTFAARMPTIYIVPERMPAAVLSTRWVDLMVVSLWAIASIVLLVRLVRAVVMLARVRRAAVPRVVDGVAVLLSQHVGPTVIGVVSPSVLFPESLLDLDEPHRRLVLQHEQEHCQAHDPWIVFAAAISLALVPWNLPLWWIARRARLALEIDCDLRVLTSTSDVSGYGKLLVLISQRQTTMTLSPMLAASTSHLERRIIAMRDAQGMPQRSLRIAVGLAGAVIVAGAACASRIGDRVAGPSRQDMAATQIGPVAVGQPYFEFQVEKTAQQIPGTGNVRYPDSLRVAKVSGEVLAQFVVDTTGAVEPGTFKALKASHARFTEAVRLALPLMKFEPAQVGGHPVRQLVQQPFTFALSGGTAVKAANVMAPSAPQYREFTIDREATQIPGTGRLIFPEALRASTVSGEVVVQYIVNRDGRVEMPSFKVLRSSDPLLTGAVMAAVTEMRFEPAMVKGTAVRQLVQMPYKFVVAQGEHRVEQGAGTRP